MALYDPTIDGAPLALLTLPVLADPRPLPELQPPLPVGIHLRWTFDNRIDNRLGFPWYGFYLFRRLMLQGGTGTICASSQLGGFTPGPQPSPDLKIGLGTFHSDQNLLLTDEFPTPGIVELDLSNRTFIEFQMDPAIPNREVKVTIGFVADFPPPGGPTGGGPGTPGGPGGPGGPGSSGSTGLGLAGSGGSSCGCGCDHAALGPIAERVVAIGGGRYRATFGYDNTGTVPISMPVGPENRFFPEPAGRGQPTMFLAGRHSGVFTVDFDGRPLTWRVAGGTVTVSSAGVDGAAGTAGTGGAGGTGGTGGNGGAGNPTSADGIVITALRAGGAVGTVVASGRAGQVVSLSIPFESIDAVRVSSGPARLVDVCVTRTTDGLESNWAPAPGFVQPLLLPVQHDSYPLQKGTPTIDDSKGRALPRIRYGFPSKQDPSQVDTSKWTEGSNFTDLFNTLVQIVQAGPPGITDFLEDIVALVDPNDPDAVPPQSTQQSSLDLLLSASTDPAMAQMLGLYWVDDSVVEGQSYDYLLVADYNNAGNGNVQTILGLVTAKNYTNISAYLRVGVVHSVSSPLTPPQRARAYVLPVGAIPPSAPADAAGLVGLRWDIPTRTNTTKLTQDASFLFNLWRKDFGRTQPVDPAPASQHTRVNDLPLAPGDPRVDDPTDIITGWPAFGLFAVDGPLVEGWYSYRLSGVDIFGRHSALSDPAAALDNASSDISTPDNFPRFVHLIDTVPPPPPTNVQGWVLDPADPQVLQDAAYTDWRNNIAQPPDVVGLRVRWVWPGKAMRQAPDTREFRIYIRAGSSMPDASVPLSWTQRIAVVAVNEGIVLDETVPAQNDAGEVLTGQNATVQVNADGNFEATLPGTPSLADLPGGGLELELARAAGGPVRFEVIAIDAQAGTVLLDRDPHLDGASAWTLFHEREYEVFLPGAALAAPPAFALPQPPSLAVPVAYGLVGVSAADDKDRDDLRTSGPLSARKGNESSVGGPAAVYQVWRTPPDPPDSPFSETKLLATRADFRSQSFFTLHFPTRTNLSLNVFRALDETLFLIDGGTAQSVRNSEVAAITAVSLGWLTAGGQPDNARRQHAVDQISALPAGTPAPADYAKLTDDALRLLASTKSNAAAFSRITNPVLPPDTANLRGPSDDENYNPGAHPNTGAFTDTLDGRAANRYFYRTSYVDGAQNASKLLSVSTPPVYLPVAAPPLPPVITSVVGFDRSIDLTWVRKPVAGVTTQFKVYRSEDSAQATDVRLMTLIATLPADPSLITTDYLDLGAPLLRDVFYRVATVVGTGDDAVESQASPPVVGRARRVSPPSPPVILAARLPGATAAVRISVTTDEPLAIFIQRSEQDGDPIWVTVANWLPAGTTTVDDVTVQPGTTFVYRARGRDDAGVQSALSQIVSVSIPS